MCDLRMATFMVQQGCYRIRLQANADTKTWRLPFDHHPCVPAKHGASNVPIHSVVLTCRRQPTCLETGMHSAAGRELAFPLSAARHAARRLDQVEAASHMVVARIERCHYLAAVMRNELC